MRKFKSRFYLYLVGGLISLVVGIILVSWSERRRLAEYRARVEWGRLAACDREQDPRKALAACLQLDPAKAPVAVRIMRRRWQLGLELYRQRSRKTEPFGKSAVPDAGENGKKLDKLLFALEKDGQNLRGRRPAPAPALSWRAENLLGAGYLMRALLVLDRGGEMKTCQALLHQAIEAFKRAIRLVDRLPAADGFGNIPRWNLELLIANERLARLAMAESSPQTRYDLRRNLTILLPGSSGYLSGEPPDSRVLK
ncbi:MAG: hypothetical protein GXO34_04440 [Deltaproteobacteria bacterium]|nr:hypothetical protein [Deltaproteobacteria bacterium]